MKKESLKSIIKHIIKEARMANVFRLIMFGDKKERELVAQTFLKIGRGQLRVRVTFPYENSTAYTVWDSEVLKTLESILRKSNWRRVGVKDKDIMWIYPDWEDQTGPNRKGTFGEGIHGDWYVKEKTERMRQEKDKKAAAKLLWGWIKSDRQMDFQKFFSLLSVLEQFHPITEPTSDDMIVYNPKPGMK